MGKRITKKGLTAQEEKFCQIYSTEKEFFGNGVQSYLEAFDLSPSKYNTAKVQASILLTNPNITARIRELIDIKLSDEMVDKELAKVILQDAEFNPKVSAIREYNKLKQRITDKLEIKVEAEDISGEQLNELIKRQAKRAKREGE